MDYNFRSDNESPAAAPIVEAVVAANSNTAWAYGEDIQSVELDRLFSELFETEVAVIPVSTGTSANSIALASVTPPWGAVYCSRAAHVFNSEGGAPEFYGHGLRLIPLQGDQGRVSADELEAQILAHEGHGIHSYAPEALTLTQSTEAGTVYPLAQISAICDVAASHGMAIHMDGARFANALVSLGCSPAECTWKAGIQMLSFGATKNGCMGAEALLLFNRPDLRGRVERLRKRGGHLLSKMRYVSAQLEAYIRDDLWLRLAYNANRQAGVFAAAVDAHPQANLEYPVEANEVFVRWHEAGFDQLAGLGMQFLTWPGRDDLARFVFSHTTLETETHALCEALSTLRHP